MEGYLTVTEHLFAANLLAQQRVEVALISVKDARVQKTQTEHTQKQSYKTHPLSPETGATVVFVYFW